MKESKLPASALADVVKSCVNCAHCTKAEHIEPCFSCSSIEQHHAKWEPHPLLLGHVAASKEPRFCPFCKSVLIKEARGAFIEVGEYDENRGSYGEERIVTEYVCGNCDRKFFA